MHFLIVHLNILFIACIFSSTIASIVLSFNSVLNSLQLRNKNLIDGIQEEGKAIMDLNVKLKIIPIRRQLNLDETVSYWLYVFVMFTRFILTTILTLIVVGFAYEIV